MKKLHRRAAAVAAAAAALALIPAGSAGADVVSCAKYEAGALAHHIVDGGPTPLPCSTS